MTVYCASQQEDEAAEGESVKVGTLQMVTKCLLWHRLVLASGQICVHMNFIPHKLNGPSSPLSPCT